MSSIRQEKVAKLVKQELSIIFQKYANDWFGGKFITVTTLRVSPDLSVAKAYLSLFMSKDKEAALAEIKRLTPQIRKELGLKVGKQLRIVPELIFYIDDSLDYAQQIDDLLKK